MEKAGTHPVRNRGARPYQANQPDLLEGLPNHACQDIIDLACYICGTPTAHIILLGAEGQRPETELVLGLDETSIAQSFSAHDLNTDEILVIEDATLDPRFANDPSVVGEPGVRFYAGAPFRNVGGQVLGTVCVLDTVPRSITEKQQRALEALARQVEVLLLQRRIEDAKVAETERRDVLIRMVAAQRATSTVDQMVQVAAEQLGRHLGAARAGYFEACEAEASDVKIGWSSDLLSPLSSV